MKTELELSEIFWKNPEYNEKMSFSAFNKLAAILQKDETVTSENKSYSTLFDENASYPRLSTELFIDKETFLRIIDEVRR